MGFSYLGGKSWLDVSREERLFCAHLYHDIRRGGLEREFVRWLKEGGTWQSDEARQSVVVHCGWEIGYEVCFYRDLLSSRNESVHATDYSDKRTFDLCLFSEKCIVIIEAKAHERFDSVQMSRLTTYWNEKKRKWVDGDKQRVERLTGQGSEPTVITVALASQRYLDKRRKGDRDVLRPPRVDAIISWQGVHEWARGNLQGYSDIYLNAEKTYESSSARKKRMSSKKPPTP